MNKFKAIAKTIRLPNLIMIALVQWIVLEYILREFALFHYFLISAATVSIALAGYIINDIADLKIDALNGHSKLITEGNKSFWWKIVALFNILGLAFGLWASLLSEITYFVYFILAIAALVSYAFFFSKYKLIGNFLISFLISLAILLVFYLGKEHPDFYRKFMFFDEIALWCYAACAFLFNWIRELIKDIEDQEGDQICGRKSLSILIGPNTVKSIVGFILLFFTFLFTYIFIDLTIPNYYFFFLGSLSFLILIFLFFTKEKADYKRLSLLLKLYMFTGILLPLF